MAIIRAIDSFTEWTGYLFVLFIVPLILSNVVEVFARYVLRAPAIWALDMTTMSYATLFMLGCALALLEGALMRTDIPARVAPGPTCVIWVSPTAETAAARPEPL